MPEKPENIQVVCPGCNSIFDLPIELGGQVGECTECGTVFEIPLIEKVSSGSVDKTETGSIKVEKAPEGTTNTVKLSRTSIGMVPSVKDNFKFDVVKKPTIQKPPTQTSTASSKKAFTAPPPSATRTAEKSQPVSRPAAQKPWWSFLLFWKK